MATIPDDYKKDFAYLKDLSDKGSLRNGNAILQKLESAARQLPGLKNALATLNVHY
jgi:hypothetical protein